MPRKAPNICILSDGRRVPFALKRRGDEPFYFICFRGPDRRRLERSSKEPNKKRAEDAAAQLIKEVYEPRAPRRGVTWDAAIARLEEAMKAANLKEGTAGDYLQQLDILREAFKETQGPGEITAESARAFKESRARCVGPVTLHGNLNKLGVIWSKWLIETLGLLDENPWASVEKPRLDEPVPRYLAPAERAAFLAWIERRYPGWRMPVLFFKAMLVTGRRITTLCSLPTSGLQEGRLAFPAANNKSRKLRYARIPADLYGELAALAGPDHVWERYPEQLNAFYRRAGLRRYARCGVFRPGRLRRWLQNLIADYCEENKDVPGFVPFTAHNFRDTAMTAAWDADVPIDKAAVAFDCNPQTMKKHYIQMEQLEIADEVFGRIHGDGGTAPSGRPGTAGSP